MGAVMHRNAVLDTLATLKILCSGIMLGRCAETCAELLLWQALLAGLCNACRHGCPILP